MGKAHIVIGISAIAGGGKSTVIAKLLELLDDAVAIYFDDYTTPETYPTDPLAWLERGSDLNEIKSPQLAGHLRALRAGDSIASPIDGTTVSPAKYILYEGPLGRARHETGQHIDFLVFIDTPLEVGLARMILRAIPDAGLEQATSDELKGQLRSVTELVEDYLTIARYGYLAQLEQVKPVSDLILDGEQSTEDLAQAVIDALNKADF